MVFPSDLEIARGAALKPLEDIADAMGIPSRLLEPHGEEVMKIKLEAIAELASQPTARYVVVSAITPTPLGEGKTTTTVGLGQGFNHIGKRATVAIRQPSMGPAFGIKGGAAAAGTRQVVPMEALNLHLTGDMHAVTAAHNLLAAMIDNHIYQGNDLGIDPYNITWRRVLDVNDRALRNIIIGLGGRADGVPRQTGFDITAASEVMATLALAGSLADLRARLRRSRDRLHPGRDPGHRRAAVRGRIDGGPAARRDQAEPAPDAGEHARAPARGPVREHRHRELLRDRRPDRHPHRRLPGQPEAGFGADMGAERFFNIKCRTSGLRPDAAVIVATVRALKAHSGKYKIVAGKPLPEDLLRENPDDVAAGAANLRKQIENIRLHGVSPVVAINSFPTDHPSEHQVIRDIAAEMGARAAVCTHFADGGRGAIELAEAVAEAAEEPSDFHFLYPDTASLRDKIAAVATQVYGAERGQLLHPGRQAAGHLRAGRASGDCRCASPRRTCRSRPTPRSRAHRPAGPCPSARCGRRSARASCTRSAATCGPCRGSAPTRPRPASTSTTTAWWSAYRDVVTSSLDPPLGLVPGPAGAGLPGSARGPDPDPGRRRSGGGDRRDGGRARRHGRAVLRAPAPGGW